MRPALAGAALALVMWWSPFAGAATCGDGVLDEDYELCDDGAANGNDACCTTSCLLVDTDRDGVCDAADPCPSPAPLLANTTLLVRGFGTAASDDSFRLTGTLTPSLPVDPAASGVTVALSNRFTGPFVSARIPGGAGWKAGPRGGWSYRDNLGATDGITRITIKPAGDGGLALEIKGRRRSYARRTDIIPAQLAVALTATEDGAGRCGEGFLSLSRCTSGAAGATLRCPVLPSPRRCASPDPDARVRCDAEKGVAAQEAYFAAHGTYYSGHCTGLPGFTPSPGMICTTAGTDLVFTLVTAGTEATLACVYDSFVPPGAAHLVCS